MSSALTELDRPRAAPLAALPWRSRLAPAHALWWHPDGLWDHGPQGLPWRQADPGVPPQQHASLAAWAEGRRGQAARLWLSGAALHDVLIETGLPFADDADDAALLAYARGVLQHYHGEAAAAWPLAAWQAAGARGVSALHAVALDSLQASLRSAGVALRSVRPAWCQALAFAARRHPPLLQGARSRLLVVEGARLTQLDLAQGRLVGLQHRRLAEASHGALVDWVAGHPVPLSLALGHGLAAPLPVAASRASLPPGLTLLGRLSSPVPGLGWWSASDDSLQAPR